MVTLHAMSAWEVGKYSYINVHLPDEGTRRRNPEKEDEVEMS